MGAPMAANLIKAGFTAAVWNRTRSKTEPLAVQGARVANGPVDCVKGADYILSILDSGPVVREVFFDSGAADAMKRGAVFIDMASIPPKMAQEHAAWLKERRGRPSRRPGLGRQRWCRGGLASDHGRRRTG
jgi:2-hydroxy-3-oxopropionate reductase